MEASLQQLDSLYETIKKEATAFSNGNNSAGTRARKALMDIKNLAQKMRADIQEVKNSRKE